PTPREGRSQGRSRPSQGTASEGVIGQAGTERSGARRRGAPQRRRGSGERRQGAGSSWPGRCGQAHEGGRRANEGERQADVRGRGENRPEGPTRQEERGRAAQAAARATQGVCPQGARRQVGSTRGCPAMGGSPTVGSRRPAGSRRVPCPLL